MLDSSLRILQFRLGMDWLCRCTKQGCLSFPPSRIRVGPNTCFPTAAAAVAAAAAAAALFVGHALCFIFFLTLLRRLYGGGCCTEPSEK